MVSVRSNLRLRVKSEPALMRHGYYRHKERNIRIAQAARAFSTQQVMIVVRTVEHLLFLRQLLPEYSIVHKGIDPERWEQF